MKHEPDHWLEQESLKLQDYLSEVRRHIHANPEYGENQPETVDYLVSLFHGMDVHLRHGPDHVGLVVDIQGEHDGPILAFRADTDALEITESHDPNHTPNRLGFRSQIDNTMHACGHDAHTAILVGLGKLAYVNRHKLHGRVRLLFQPGEEGYHGARRMVENGYLDKVTSVFALHCYPLLKVGQIGIRKGSMMAAVDAFMVIISGIGGHGSSPETASDQVLALCRTITNLETIISRRISPLDPTVLTVGYAHAGHRSSRSVLPETAEFGGTMRTFNPEVSEFIKNEFAELCEASVKSVHPACTVTIDYHHGYPATVNDEKSVDLVAEVGATFIPQENLFPAHPPLLGSEDFSYMLQQTLGAMFLLGVSAPEQDLSTAPFLHNPRFDIDERALSFGTRVFAEIAFQYSERMEK